MKRRGGTAIAFLFGLIAAAAMVPEDARADSLIPADFLDGFHLGDAAQARALGLLAHADARLAPFINTAEVTRLSAPGMKPVQYLTEDFGLKATDYLGLDCAWAAGP